MNKSPWKETDKAFEQMFDESVVLTHGSKTNTIKAAVFTDMTGDSITDDNMDTDREDIYLVCGRKDWPFVQKLKRGDKVTRTDYNGLEYKVTSVKNDVIMGWCIYARSV